MSNENLVNLATRTQQERKEIARQGGFKSGKTRLAKSYNENLVKMLDLSFDIEQIKKNKYYFKLDAERKKVLIELKEAEIKELEVLATEKKEKYNKKYEADIDNDLEKIIKHLNRKYDKEERRLINEYEETSL